MRAKPPFRADIVGSFLRSPELKSAREQRQKGVLSPAGLAAVEDREIAAIVARQQDCGLETVTDGEQRREWWHFDFLAHLNGAEYFTPPQGIQFHGIQTKPRAVRIVGKLDFPADHPHLAHFRYLQSVAKVTPKMSIPSPSMLHYRGGRALVDAAVYPDMEAYYHDLGQAYAKAVRAFHDAGCRYLQIDDTSLSYFCDPAQRAMLTARGDDPDAVFRQYRDMLNTATRGRPKDMVVATHTCRGNFRSSFVAQGGYEPVAELVFNDIDVDAYFMEWDTERAGGFEPLRLLPKDKTVVLGLVSTKVGALESKDALKRRIDEAAKHAPLEQLCLSPQCGFASSEEGNNLAYEEQWAKVARVVEVAREVWG